MMIMGSQSSSSMILSFCRTIFMFSYKVMANVFGFVVVAVAGGPPPAWMERGADKGGKVEVD